ncbi:DUF4412 domain-containing protein [Parachryseolinea silvisoli]|jgi:hypothetical protein|uniref:DUF4412 domain-containing protein n=1 Tax=Parachryseolinea silvisoli TaxID=2873601 RepID=UPI002265B59D|nr:DUF4412 domain-containing protein [Parachryseolinea silvisoli]MCD9018504.1 DUF4412 domain-containing protein [Parachryseolinea silvisoli]
MKQLFFAALLLLLVLPGHAQLFEGTIRWKMEAVITDPATKAKMEEAQKKMNDPATQAQMKELEAKMSDPQFKAMMDANPQMKTQMEAMLKAAKGGNINSFIPTGLEQKTKNGNALTKMEGGIMANMEILYLKDKNQSYRIDRESKTYSVLPKGDENQDDKTKTPEVKVTKTTETKKILDYTCTKYVAETTYEGKKSTQIFWTTTAIQDFDMKSMAQQRFGNHPQLLFYEKIDGVPLRIEMTVPEGNMTMEVTSLKRHALPAADFAIPTGYKETQLSMFGR